MPSKPNLRIDYLPLLADACRNSYYRFFRTFWDIVSEESLVDNWHIKYLCDDLQATAHRVFDDLPRLHHTIVNVAPGSSKSTIYSVMFPAWVWTQQRKGEPVGTKYRFLCCTNTDSLGIELSSKTRDIIQSARYRALFPYVQIKDDRNTLSYYKLVGGGWRRVVTVGGKSPIGQHAHFIICDDPIAPEDTVSKKLLNTANQFMSGTLPTRMVNKDKTPIVLVMQRLHQNDPTGYMLERMKDSIHHICLPVTLKRSDNTDNIVKPAHVVDYYNDGLFDPVRQSRSILQELSRIMGAHKYSGQCDQNPIPDGGQLFQLDRINYADTMPTRFLKQVRYWDKAGSLNSGKYTAGVKMGIDDQGRVWILDVVRFREEASFRESTIKAIATRDGVDCFVGIEQEPGSSGKDMATFTIRNLRGFKVFADRPTGDKESRAYPFASQMNGGNVWMRRNQNWQSDYLEELQYFPNSTYMDQVDASSGGFNLLTAKGGAGVF